MRLTEQQRRLLRLAGYPALAIVVFFTALWVTFPVDRVEAKLINTLSPHVKIQLESLEKGFFPGNFTFRNVVIETRPKTHDEKPAKFIIDELNTSFGILSLLTGTASVDLEAVLGAGTVEGDIAASADGLELEIATESLAMGGIPGLQVLFAGLPAKGGMNAELDLELPKFRWDEAKGKIALACPNCVVGPGKVTPRTDDSPRARRMAAFASEGITLPEIQLGKADILIEFGDGRAVFERFEAVSDDGELYAEGYIDMKPSFAKSEPHVCFRFKFSDTIKKKNARVEGMERGMEKARRPDGYIGMRMTGTMERPKRIGSKACIPGKPPGSARTPRTRPSISSTRPTPRPAIPPPNRPSEADDDESGDTARAIEARPLQPDDAPPPAAIPSPRESGPALKPRRDDVGMRADDDDDDDDELLEEDLPPDPPEGDPLVDDEDDFDDEVDERLNDEDEYP